MSEKRLREGETGIRGRKERKREMRGRKEKERERERKKERVSLEDRNTFVLELPRPTRKEKPSVWL